MPGRRRNSSRHGARLPEVNTGMQHPGLVVDHDDIVWAFVLRDTERLTEEEAGMGEIDISQLPVIAAWIGAYSIEGAQIIERLYWQHVSNDDTHDTA